VRKLKFISVFVLLALLMGVGAQVGSPARAGSYSRSDAVAHADTYAHSRSPDYPNYGTGSGCTDCTNYVSQVLHKGGLPEIEGSDDIWHWYYYWHWWYGWRGSKTWAATDWLNTHASQYQGSRFEYKHPSNLGAGDFFLMDLATNPFEGPDHARVIVGWGSVEEGDCIGCWRLLANQHCTDRKRVRWNYAIPGNTPVWGWRVVW
jgi:hypothetical protein